MKNIFISGIPCSGKTTLARRIHQLTGVHMIEGDGIRGDIGNQNSDTLARDWANFFKNQNEEQYWKKTKCDEHINNLKKQCKTIWPYFVERIKQVNEPFIIEGVNILPHLAYQDFDFPGIVLLRKSREDIYQTIKGSPYWSTENNTLQKKEAEILFFWEAPFYEEEAKEYGYNVFTDLNKAEKEILNLMKE